MKQLLLAAMLMGIAIPVYAQSATEIVTDVSKAHGVDPKLALAVARVESSLNCTAKSSRRRDAAQGVMQVKPSTARAMGVSGSLTTCHNGATAGVRYLKAAIDRGGMTCAGISLYNRGVGAPLRCTGYGRKVLLAYSKM